MRCNMEKGWKIALIVVGAFLLICAMVFLVLYFAGSRFYRGYDSYGSVRRWDGPADRYFKMPHGGMMHRWDGSSTANEDFYLEHWIAILGISKEELQNRLDSGESLESIAESLGIEMPCWDRNADDERADLSTTPTRDGGWVNGAGMCF